MRKKNKTCLGFEVSGGGAGIPRKSTKIGPCSPLDVRQISTIQRMSAGYPPSAEYVSNTEYLSSVGFRISAEHPVDGGYPADIPLAGSDICFFPLLLSLCLNFFRRVGFPIIFISSFLLFFSRIRFSPLLTSTFARIPDSWRP